MDQGHKVMDARWLNGSLQFSYQAGNVFYVNSQIGDDTFTGATWLNCLATIDAAVDKCTASRGDVIYVAPCHAENLAADSAIDIDVAGVSVLGLRNGRQMPTLTATATGGDLKLAAANVAIANIRVLGGIDATSGAIEVTGVDCAIFDSEYRDVTGQCTDGIMVVDGADRLLIDGFRHFGAAGAGTNAALAVDGADDIEIKNFYLYGNFAVGGVDFRTTASARVRVHTGTIWTANAADIAIVDTVTGSTGFIGPDIQIMLTDNAANITEAVTGATFQLMDPVYVCNLVNEKGMLIDWTASTDA